MAILPEPNQKGKRNEYLKDIIHFWNRVNKGKRPNAGVSIIINKKYKKYITNWNFINRRIVMVELNIFEKK
jgi:hypothetical protein